MKQILILSIAIFLCGETLSREREQETLLRIAASVLDRPSAPRQRGMAIDREDRTLRVIEQRAALAVVGSDVAGFAIVSRDDRVRPVLAYSMTGVFNKHDIPCGLKWYLDALDSNLQAMAADGYEWAPVDMKPHGNVKPMVEPLLQTDWYQGTPFNDWVPTYTDDNGSTKHFSAGCGCTAAAQVMYYHKHPEVGRGEVTYIYHPTHTTNMPVEDKDYPVELSCRFDTVHFDWSKMQARYDKRHSDDEDANTAVARLCAALGAGLKMQYTEKTGSGTSAKQIPETLTKHFGYSKDIRYTERSNYSDSLWMSTVFDELSNSRPVIYRGRPEDNVTGHLFVVDGYDADGLVHINWGFGNNSKYDGYFNINCLRPNNSTADYTAQQAMVVHTRPEHRAINMTELTLTQPGTLASLLTGHRAYRLKLSGTLNADDLKTLQQMGRGMKNNEGVITRELTHLDLSGATVPDNVIPEKMFEDCKSLIYMVLPQNLERLEQLSFHNCSNLTQLVMPSGLQHIGDYAMHNCTSLTDVCLPKGLKTLGNVPFAACVAISGFSVEEGNTHFTAIDGILTTADGKKLVAHPIARTEATIPASVDSIGPHAFRYCVNLTDVHIPQHVKVVCESAFMNCSNLGTVTIEEGVKRILGMAFNNCDSLRTLHLPASIDSIGRRLFIYADNMQTVTISDNNPNFCVENNCLLSHDRKRLVQSILTEVETVDIPASVESIERFAIFYSKAKSLTVPSTLKKIGRESIYFCQELTQIVIEEGLEVIDNYAFNGCSALTEMHLPSSLKTIGCAIFVNCSGLQHAYIDQASPLFQSRDNMLFSKDATRLLQQLADNKKEYVVLETVTSIAPNCFQYKTNLQQITIPTSVTSIGNYVLYGCTSIKDVFCLSSAPIRLGQYVFAKTDLSNATLHVPYGQRQAYLDATGWNLFGNIVEMAATPCDVNGDGKINTADIAAIIGVIAEGHDSPYINAADVNNDGHVDIADIISVISSISHE